MPSQGKDSPAHLIRGRSAEQAAANFVSKQGLIILQRNVRFRGGEIDIIAKQPPDGIVFIEVRFRASDHFGSAAESIDIHKQRRIAKAARSWLQKHDPAEKNWCRFDAICLSPEGKKYRIDWIENAFTD